MLFHLLVQIKHICSILYIFRPITDLIPTHTNLIIITPLINNKHNNNNKKNHCSHNGSLTPSI